MTSKPSQRLFPIDLLRVLACFLVVHQHCAQQFYAITGKVEVGDDTFFVGINSALGRISVPLFVMVSGYFLLPMRGTLKNFMQRRLSRIVAPFIVWYAIYCVFFIFYSGDSPMQAVANFFGLFVNFMGPLEHLWYIYMIIGLYLIVPIISPWVERASKRELQLYLGLWLISGFLPYLHAYVSPEMWGECFWNSNSMMYWFTGFGGYMLAGHYLRRFGAFSVLGSIVMIVIGWIPTSVLFIHRMFQYNDFEHLEMSFNFGSLGVILMSLGVFSLFMHLRCKGEGAIGRLLSDVAAKGYGMYLGHIVVLLLVHTLLCNCYPDIFNVVTGEGYTYHRIWGNIPAVLVAVPIHACITFVLTYALMKLLSLVPKLGKLVGA